MGEMYTTSDFRNGLKVELEGEPYEITYFQAVSPGKGGGFTRTKMRNLISGLVLERTFKSGEKVGKPDVEEQKMQYLYEEGEGYVFMDNSTYEQITISKDVVGDDKDFLIENVEADVLFFNGRPIGLTFPFHMVMKIVYCEPGLRGDTATGATKPAKLESGLVVQVPLFVNEGEKIKIDTRDRSYTERVKD